MSSPRLYFLGTPMVERKRKNVPLPAKAIALLAFLAVTRVPQARERILGLLWAESSGEAARKNLRNALWSIRKGLGDAALAAGEDRLSLADSAWIDVREFEELADLRSRDSSSPADTVSYIRSHVALYRAPLLEGLVVSDAPEFEIWLTSERERLAQIYLHAQSVLVDLLRARRDWRGVIAAARDALAQDPLQEPMYRAWMQAHAQIGERAQALRAYETLRAALERELGVEPLPETEHLRELIVSGRTEPPGPTPAVRAPALSAESFQTPLIGRQSEMAVLDDELQKAIGGAVRVAFISGETGIGKSRLWQEWSRTRLPALAPAAFVLETRAFESTRSVPLAPLAQLLDRPEVRERLWAQDSPVALPWLAEMSRLLPEIRAAIPNLPAPTTLPPDEGRRRLFEAFTQSLLALGGKPLVLFVDDAHWADRATLDWLGYFIHRMQDRPLLPVVTYRTEDAPASLIHLIASLAREGLTHRLPLARLSPEESAALVAALSVDPGAARSVMAQSAGNPYFLIELVRAAPAEIPPALHDLVRARLQELPETARQVVQAAAILEPRFELAILRRTSGRGEAETVDAVDALLRANILVERGRYYDFSHPFAAEIVREGLSGARRGYLHRRAAEALEAAHAGRLAPVAGRLTQRYALAGDTARAAHYAVMAAEHALELAAPEQAVEFYRQALGLEPTPERRLGLGRVLLRMGQIADARAEFESAFHDLETAGEKRGAARAALDIAETYFPSGRFDEGKRWSDRALGFLETEDDPVAHATAHLLLGIGPADHATSAAMKKQHLVEATHHAAEHDLNDIAARGYFLLGSLLAEQGDLPEALESYRQSIWFAHAAGNEYEEILAYNNLAYHALLLGDLDTARAHVQSGLQLAEDRALRLPLQYLYSTRGEVALAEGRWNDAEAWFKQGQAIADALGNTEQSANYRANLALAARGRGDLDGALVLLEEARAAIAGLSSTHLRIKIDLWLAEIYRQRGERAAFEEALTRAERELEDSGRKSLIEWARKLRSIQPERKPVPVKRTSD